jgi:hypothetical protein
MLFRFKNPLALGVTVVACVGYCPQPALAEMKPKRQQIAIPNAALLGKPVGECKAFGGKSTQFVYPENVQFDLDKDIVYGLIAVYPAEVMFAELVDAVNENHRKWWRDADGEMSKYGVSVWRNEAARVAIQVSDSQVIMIWLDRHVTEREKKVVSKALLEIKKATDKKPSTAKKQDVPAK